MTEGSTCNVIQGTGHQLVIQAPVECCAQIALVVHGEEIADEIRERFAVEEEEEPVDSNADTDEPQQASDQIQEEL